MKSGRDNFCKFAKVPVTISDFLPVTKQKVPVTNQLFFLRNFKSPVKVTGFFFREKFIGHSFIRNPEISLFCRTKGGKRQVLFCLPGKVHTSFIQNLVGFQLFYKDVYIFFRNFVCFCSVFLFLEECKYHKFIWSQSRFFAIVKKKAAFSALQSNFSKNSLIDFVQENKVRYLCTQNKGYLRWDLQKPEIPTTNKRWSTHAREILSYKLKKNLH